MPELKLPPNVLDVIVGNCLHGDGAISGVASSKSRLSTGLLGKVHRHEIRHETPPSLITAFHAQIATFVQQNGVQQNGVRFTYDRLNYCGLVDVRGERRRTMGFRFDHGAEVILPQRPLLLEVLPDGFQFVVRNSLA